MYELEIKTFGLGSTISFYARHLQQINWNKTFCRMHGLAVMLSVATRRTSKNIDKIDKIL